MNLSEKRKEIFNDLQRAHKKMLEKGFVSYGTFRRIYDKILKQDKQAIKKLKELLIGHGIYGDGKIHLELDTFNDDIKEIFGEELVE